MKQNDTISYMIRYHTNCDIILYHVIRHNVNHIIVPLHTILNIVSYNKRCIKIYVYYNL